MEPRIDVIEPGRLEVSYVAGNEGLEPLGRVRVMNATERRLVARNLDLRVPWLSSADLYRVSTDYIEFDGSRVEARHRSARYWTTATAA